jgi:glycosyltransferase involved in cell wall biosynthesis
VIKTLALYADRSGCGDYRVRLPAEAVNKRSAELGVQVETAESLGADAVFEGPICRVRRVDVPAGVSVVSFQRPMKASLVGAMAWLRQCRPDIGLVVELDDDLAGVPVNHVAYSQIMPKTSPTENVAWLHKAIQHCDVLTVSTPELARRYSGTGHRTIVIRNGVHTSMLDQPARTMTRVPAQRELNRERIVGWAGYTGTHAGDLEITSGALADVVGPGGPGSRQVRFRNIGPRDGIAQALNLGFADVEASGWLSTDLYRTALSELDVGIVPLANTRFNRSKSALKAIEMAAAGVPVIASKLPEFEELQRRGMPLWLVKDRRKEWVSALNRMLALDDKALRELAQAHREFVRRYETVDSHAREWADAWTAASRIARLRVTGGRRPAQVAS